MISCGGTDHEHTIDKTKKFKEMHKHTKKNEINRANKQTYQRFFTHSPSVHV